MKIIFVFLFLFNPLFSQEILQKNEIVEEVVKLFKTGLSQELIINYIENYKKEYEINADDLIYLKENNIPEEIIKKLLSNQPLILKKEEKNYPKEFNNLVLKNGLIKKDRLGNIALKEDRVEWLDLKNPSKNFSFRIKNIKAIWLKCKPRAVENFCYEIVFSNYDGKEFNFSDFNWEKGENKIITELYNFFKENFKEIIYQEKVK